MNNVFHIIYQTQEGAQTLFENQYWNEWVLKKIDKEIYYDNGQLSIVFSNALVLYSTNNYNISVNLHSYFQKLEKPVLVHLSNEAQNHNAEYYKRARAVLRTAAWSPNSAFPNVFTLPLGFQSGYMNDQFNVALFERDLIWAFAGAIKQDRQAMLDALAQIGPNWYFKSSDWGSADMKTTEDLIEIYKRSIFAPTPFGNINYECFRTMESLEWGCIPVTTEFLGEDCYKYVYGDHPFIVGKDWADVAKQVKNLVDDPRKMKIKQEEVWQWYRLFKEELQEDVSNIVEGKFDAIRGKQFTYQKEARNSRKLRWRFFKHFTLKVYWKRLVGRAIKSKNG